MKLLKPNTRLIWILTFSFAISCSKNENITTSSTMLRIAGSDTELEVVKNIASEYKNKLKPTESIKVEGGGSSIGIQKLIDGEVSIANSSRPMNFQEREMLEDIGVSFDEYIIANDAISIIADPQIGVTSLSTLDLSNIFTGRVRNWKELGGKNLKITIMGRDENSGTRSYLENRFARYEGFSSNHKALSSNNEIVEQVEKTDGAIGYVGIGYIMNSMGKPIQSVWTMQIYVEGGEHHSPYEMMAMSQEKYELSRPLYQYVISSDDEAKKFIEFEGSAEGQSIIRKHGFYLSNQ